LQNQQLCFEAYVKTVQYLAGVTVHQHLWTEVVSLMINFFSADSAAICERQEGGEIIFAYTRPENHPIHAWFRDSKVKGMIAEVFDSGFFATLDIQEDEIHKVLFLPITSENRSTAVLVTTYRSEEDLSRDHLNTSLAIAGIIGTTHSRLSAETELRMHRNMLEELVFKRTKELKETILKLEQEVLQRTRAEKALQKMNEELEIRVAERTEELEKQREELEMQNDELQETYLELEMQTEERLRAMEELREKERMLIQQSRQAALGEMIGNIAHQLRQPLNNLALMIQSSPLAHQTDEFSLEYLKSVEEKSMHIIRHMSQTINDFRNYFKPDKEKVPFHVNVAIAKTISLIEDSFKCHNIFIDINAAEDPVINGYPNEYSQVLLNILLNARDAFSERSVSAPRVTITIGTENERVFVTIADNGGGIPEEILHKIFDPYFTTKGPEKGTGVGLFMSKNIIERNLGGRLTVRNIATGAEFRIDV